jgi:hypothetical protein
MGDQKACASTCGHIPACSSRTSSIARIRLRQLGVGGQVVKSLFPILTWLEVCPTIAIDTNTAVLCGGRGSDDLPSGKCFEYSATNDKWTEWAEKLNVPRWGLGMSVYKGKCRLDGCSGAEEGFTFITAL